MSVINFKCKKCGSNRYEIREKASSTGIMKGLYCADCGCYHKWLGKKDEVRGECVTRGTTPFKQVTDEREKAIIKQTAQEIANMIRELRNEHGTSSLERQYLRAVAEKIEMTYGLEVKK